MQPPDLDMPPTPSPGSLISIAAATWIHRRDADCPLRHPLPGEAERKERLLALIDGFTSRRVLVVGDLIADEFIYGEVARVSREAPVLILKYDATEMVAGGAGNAANNVAALGGRARLAGLVGADPEGRRLLASFHRGVDRAAVVRAAGTATPIKTRILAGGVHSAKQQIVRIDRETGLAARPKRSAARLRRSSAGAATGATPSLLSDYGSGLVTPALADTVRRTPSARHAPPDSRARRFAVSPARLSRPDAPARRTNRKSSRCSASASTTRRVLERAGRLLLRRTRMEAVLITRGSRGMALFQPKQPTIHMPIFGSDEVTDVTGAGDTVIATFRAGARRRRVVLRSGAAGQLCRRPRGDEARHRHRVGARAGRCRDERSRHVDSRTGRRKGRRRGDGLRKVRTLDIRTSDCEVEVEGRTNRARSLVRS